MAISYTGKLLDSELSGGKGYGEALNKIREAAEERRDALLNMGGDYVDDDTVKIKGLQFLDAFYFIRTYKGLSGREGVFNQTFISNLDDNNIVGVASGSESYASPITADGFNNPNPVTHDINPYETLTNGVVRSDLSVSLGDVAIGGGKPYNKNTLDLYRCGIGLTNFFRVIPASTKVVDYATVPSTPFPTGAEVGYEGGPFSTIPLAVADISATQGNVSSLLDTKLTIDTTSANISTFSSTVDYLYSWSTPLTGSDYYSQITIDGQSSTSYDQWQIDTPVFKDHNNNTVAGDSKLAGKVEIGIFDSPNEDIDIDYTMTSFGLAGTMDALDSMAFTGDLERIGLNGSKSGLFAASDYSACFTSKATIT